MLTKQQLLMVPLLAMMLIFVTALVFLREVEYLWLLLIFGGLAFVVAMLKQPVMAIYIFIFSIPFEGISLLENFSVSRLAGILALIAFVMLVLLRQISFRFNAIDCLVYSFYVICLLSYFWSYNTDVSLNALLRLTMIMVMYVLVSNYITNLRQAGDMLLVYSLGCIVSVVYALFTGQAIVSGDLYRLFGAVGDPNEFVQTLAVAFPFLVFSIKASNKRWQSYLSTFGVLVFVVAIILSGSRTGVLWLALFSLYLFYRFVWLERKWMLAIFLGGCIVVSLTFAPGGTLDRLYSLKNLRHERGESVTLRLLNVDSAIEMSLDSPFGVGIRNYQELSWRYGSRIKGDVAHNTYLEILTGTGLVGLLIFLTIIYKVVRSSYRLNKKSYQGSAIFFGYLSFLFLSMFLSSDLAKLILLFPAIVSGLDKGGQEGEHDPAPENALLEI